MSIVFTGQSAQDTPYHDPAIIWPRTRQHTFEWETRTELLTLPGAGNNGREVAFSPDGKYLAVTTSNGLVRIYVLPVEDLLALAETRVLRTMTDQECQRFLHMKQC